MVGKFIWRESLEHLKGGRGGSREGRGRHAKDECEVHYENKTQRNSTKQLSLFFGIENGTKDRTRLDWLWKRSFSWSVLSEEGSCADMSTALSSALFSRRLLIFCLQGGQGGVKQNTGNIQQGRHLGRQAGRQAGRRRLKERGRGTGKKAPRAGRAPEEGFAGRIVCLLFLLVLLLQIRQAYIGAPCRRD